ncbi:flagellar biosynthetic protein FliR [Butyrivibrio proteoclasticus]|uniref:Flagellar biosynthetic protein FliR n=1 Tax=Butyrivibrio proteoclasticus TaxID=43305 RepID=A0A1I5QJL5_9FIRM|nr:flagellar biosynthetic protein FliR [Butyrivibrio proteoclasticus]SFP46240.1 flagellar biosynthetic protein FliR [Butyrivibrio proteoclasticus]
MIDYSFSYGDLEIFLLVVVRVTSFIFVCPFFGGRQTPNLVKIGFGILLSILIYGAVPFNPPDYVTTIEYTIIVLKEVMAGFLLGYAVQLSTLIVNFAGMIVDMQIGLSMVNLFDPNTNEQSTITGTFYAQVLTIMLIISGMYHFILKALADSFSLIPINGIVINSDRMLNAVVAFLRDYIVIGFRIALPIFIITFITNVVLGILAKVSPQMNMFSVGIQIKIVIGLAIMLITVTMLDNAANFIYVNIKELMNEFVYSMQSS